MLSNPAVYQGQLIFRANTSIGLILGAGLMSEYLSSIALNIALLLALSSILYGLWWIPRENYRHFTSRAAPSSYNWLRGLPFLASLSLFVKLGLLIYVLLDVPSLDEPTTASIAFTVMSVVFVLMAILSLSASLYGFRKDTPLLLRWHSLIVSIALVGMAIVLIYQRLVGVRLWTL